MRRGQSTTEYMMTISFICIAIAAVMFGFYNTVANETGATGRSLAQSLTTGGAQR